MLKVASMELLSAIDLPWLLSLCLHSDPPLEGCQLMSVIQCQLLLILNVFVFFKSHKITFQIMSFGVISAYFTVRTGCCVSSAIALNVA